MHRVEKWLLHSSNNNISVWTAGEQRRQLKVHNMMEHDLNIKLLNAITCVTILPEIADRPGKQDQIGNFQRLLSNRI